MTKEEARELLKESGWLIDFERIGEECFHPESGRILNNLLSLMAYNKANTTTWVAFMVLLEKDEDLLDCFDDLMQHAEAYREVLQNIMKRLEELEQERLEIVTRRNL